MKKLILILLAICSLQNVNCAQAPHINDTLPIVDISILPSDFQCPICLNGVEEDNVICRTSCNHIFHKKCMQRHLTENSEKACPMCRQAQVGVLYTALDLAEACRNQDLVAAQTIVNYGILPNADAILLTCEKNNTALAEIIFQNGIDDLHINNFINNENIFDVFSGVVYFNSLMYACNHGNKRLVELLLENGADINHKVITTKIVLADGGEIEFTATPLFIACCNNNRELASFLLENGASKIDDRDEFYYECAGIMSMICSNNGHNPPVDYLFTPLAMDRLVRKIHADTPKF